MKFARTLNEAFNDASRAQWIEGPTASERAESRAWAGLHILCVVALAIVIPLIYTGVL